MPFQAAAPHKKRAAWGLGLAVSSLVRLPGGSDVAHRALCGVWG